MQPATVTYIHFERREGGSAGAARVGGTLAASATKHLRGGGTREAITMHATRPPNATEEALAPKIILQFG